MKLLHPANTFKYLEMMQPDGGCLLSLVEDISWWEELAALQGVGVNMAKFAASMLAEFGQWLLNKTEEEK